MRSAAQCLQVGQPPEAYSAFALSGKALCVISRSTQSDYSVQMSASARDGVGERVGEEEARRSGIASRSEREEKEDNNLSAVALSRYTPGTGQ